MTEFGYSKRHDLPELTEKRKRCRCKTCKHLLKAWPLSGDMNPFFCCEIIHPRFDTVVHPDTGCIKWEKKDHPKKWKVIK